MPVIVIWNMDKIKNSKPRKVQAQSQRIKDVYNKIRLFRPQAENEGMFYKEIAQKVQCGEKTVSRLVKREQWNLTKTEVRLTKILANGLKIGQKKNIILRMVMVV